MIVLTLDPVWTGDLDDDCHAEWNGMFLHCENMGACDAPVDCLDCSETPVSCDRSEWWWWGVTRDGCDDLAGSNMTPGPPPSSGAEAREACLAAARKLLRGES